MDPDVLRIIESHNRVCDKTDEAAALCPLCQLALGMVSAKESGLPPHLYLGVVVELINHIWGDDADLPTVELFLVPASEEMH